MKYFSESVEMIMWSLNFILLILCPMIIGFQMLKQLFVAEIVPTWP